MPEVFYCLNEKVLLSQKLLEGVVSHKVLHYHASFNARQIFWVITNGVQCLSPCKAFDSTLFSSFVFICRMPSWNWRGILWWTDLEPRQQHVHYLYMWCKSPVFMINPLDSDTQCFSWKVVDYCRLENGKSTPVVVYKHAIQQACESFIQLGNPV